MHAAASRQLCCCILPRCSFLLTHRLSTLPTMLQPSHAVPIPCLMQRTALHCSALLRTALLYLSKITVSLHFPFPFPCLLPLHVILLPEFLFLSFPFPSFLSQFNSHSLTLLLSLSFTAFLSVPSPSWLHPRLNCSLPTCLVPSCSLTFRLSVCRHYTLLCMECCSSHPFTRPRVVHVCCPADQLPSYQVGFDPRRSCLLHSLVA